MNTLAGNPLVPVTNGDGSLVHVPSSFLPGLGDEFTIPALPILNTQLTVPTTTTTEQPASQSSPGTPSTTSTVISAVGAAAQGALGAVTGGAIGGDVGTAAFSGIATVIVGLLFLAAGIFSFKGARDVATTAVRTAAAA